jgi:hypothetical protein
MLYWTEKQKYNIVSASFNAQLHSSNIINSMFFLIQPHEKIKTIQRSTEKLGVKEELSGIVLKL